MTHSIPAEASQGDSDWLDELIRKWGETYTDNEFKQAIQAHQADAVLAARINEHKVVLDKLRPGMTVEDVIAFFTERVAELQRQKGDI